MSDTMFQPGKVRFGITPTVWTNDDMPLLGDDIPFEQCISEMALAGFEGCSVGHKFPTDVAILRRALELRGLIVSEPWVGTYFTVREMEQQTVVRFNDRMKFMKAMGGTEMVVAELGNAVHQQAVAVLPNKPDFTDSQWKALASGLNRLGHIATENGMALSYHPHIGTGVETGSDIDRLMSETEPEHVHLLIDTGHLYYAGEDPLVVAQRHASRVKHLHLKDIRLDVLVTSVKQGLSFLDSIVAGVFTVPSDGVIDFSPILECMARHGYQGWLIVEAEQDPDKAHPLTYAKIARSYLRRITGL
jgi:inosose dehydratase